MFSFQRTFTILLCIVFFASFCYADDITYTNKELARNGSFELGLFETWNQYRCDISSLEGKDGSYGISLASFWGSAHDHYFFQKLTIPSEIESATIRFDYRADENPTIDDLAGTFQVCIAKSKGFDSVNLEEVPPLTIIGTIHSEIIDSTFDWKELTAELDKEIIAGMQAAHDAGEFVFLLFYQKKIHERQRYEPWIDNISFKVNGKQRVPEMHGKIAYYKTNEDHDPCAISILDPNNNNVDKIWTHPDGAFDMWSNITWKPDATELAFVSDHDFEFSIFRADIFSIKPNGSGLQPIPKLPDQEGSDKENSPRVTVKGILKANTGSSGTSYTITLGIQGTDKGTHLVVGDDEEVAFTIPDVPVLGDPKIFDQLLIMYYSSTHCKGGIQYAVPAGMVNNGSVDLGTIMFFANNCVGELTGDYPNDLSWTHDGSKIGFSFWGLRKMNADATEGFIIEEIEPHGGGLSGELAWSPVDNRYLYCDFSYVNARTELYIAEEGGTPQFLTSNIKSIFTPAWLPDGTGFIYVGWTEDDIHYPDENIFQYDLENGHTTRLTYFCKAHIDHLSISPDGRHIVFQMRDEISDPDGSDLWIMDRTNPVDIWPITESSHCISPDWSRKEVAADDDADNKDDDAENINDDAANNSDSGNGGGGGGGCFVATCR